VGAKSFTVSQGNRYRKGDRIVVLNDMNDKWLHDMSRMKRWGWTSSYYKLIHRRVVTAVVGNKIYINAPIVQAIENQYGGGIVYKYYTLSEPIRNIGFEGLRLKSSYLSEYDEQHGWSGIVYSGKSALVLFYGVNSCVQNEVLLTWLLSCTNICYNRLSFVILNRDNTHLPGVNDSWVRQVTGENFGYGLFSAESWTKHVTVEDSAMLDHKSLIRGGRRYSFSLDRAEFILLQRLLTRDGRHDFVSHSRVSQYTVAVLKDSSIFLNPPLINSLRHQVPTFFLIVLPPILTVISDHIIVMQQDSFMITYQVIISMSAIDTTQELDSKYDTGPFFLHQVELF